jgi:Fe-S-cluster-containing dehydrogenase component
MPKKLNRRSFLKGALAAVGATAASGLPLPQVVKAASGSGKELATLLDLSKCEGCEECVYACRTANEKYQPGTPEKPFPEMFPPRVPVEDWSDKQEVTDRLTPYNWLYIQRFSVEHDGEEWEINAPRRCMHCQNPPCANLCPWGAARQLPNGITHIDPDICLGGAKCRKVCPWQIPQRQTGVGLYLDLMPAYAGNGVMYKCHRCYERLEQGEMPACIEACPYGVQTIGPRDEIVAQAHALAKEMNGYIYGEHENGGTNTIYVSPVPFEKLNKAMEKEINQNIRQALDDAGSTNTSPGKGSGQGAGSHAGQKNPQRQKIMRKHHQGRPHFAPVQDTMATPENLTAALVLAPIAGAALAVGKIRKAVRGGNGGNNQTSEGTNHE